MCIAYLEPMDLHSNSSMLQHISLLESNQVYPSQVEQKQLYTAMVVAERGPH